MGIVLKSILYLFGFASNPFKVHKRHGFYGSDYEAIGSDWRNVGLDIHNAMQKYEGQ